MHNYGSLAIHHRNSNLPLPGNAVDFITAYLGQPASLPLRRRWSPSRDINLQMPCSIGLPLRDAKMTEAEGGGENQLRQRREERPQGWAQSATPPRNLAKNAHPLSLTLFVRRRRRPLQREFTAWRSGWESCRRPPPLSLSISSLYFSFDGNFPAAPPLKVMKTQ